MQPCRRHKLSGHRARRERGNVGAGGRRPVRGLDDRRRDAFAGQGAGQPLQQAHHLEGLAAEADDLTQRILQEQYDWSIAEMWGKQAEIAGPVMASEDAKEGAGAFKEKRDPVWKGR